MDGKSRSVNIRKKCLLEIRVISDNKSALTMDISFVVNIQSIELFTILQLALDLSLNPTSCHCVSLACHSKLGVVVMLYAK